jgi:membrane protease subunit HflK
MPDRRWPPEGWKTKSPGVPELVSELRRRWESANGGGGLLAVLLTGLFIVVVAWSSWFTVQPQETAIVLRFGEVVRTAGPGLHLKWPYGIESVIAVPTARVLKEEFGFRTAAAGRRTDYSVAPLKEESLMLTGDLNVIDVQWIVQYRIEDPIRFLFRVRDTQPDDPRRLRSGHAACSRQPYRKRRPHRRARRDLEGS